MFLSAIYNYRSTEPVWFRFFRGFFAITLTGIIIYYSVNQYLRLDKEAFITIKLEYSTGSAYIISYKPIIINNEDTFGSLKYKLELNLQLEQLPIQLESNEVRLKVLPIELSYSRIARFESTKIFGYTDLISNLGGFYGAIVVEKVNKRPEGSSLEERVQILETLLRDYYLDDYYLKKVKDVRTKRKSLLKKYKEINRQDNENTENTEFNSLV
ncbi:18647_t:CDS:2 [Rhizophagus irregularis]|nr:18647_t:CDS:2 [Rhizophagus irregularis]